MYNKIILENGIRILYEKIPYVRSATFGIWIESGSCHEPDELSGISHFIEHLSFKGTKERTAKDIAQEFDAMGGYVNAFTSKEVTCFYAKTLDSHILQGLDILCDMVQNSIFEKSDVETEKRIVFEEISMYEDSPEDLVVEEFLRNVWPKHPLGRNVLGSIDTVGALESSIIKKYIGENYSADNIIISISGNFQVEGIINFISEHFNEYGKNELNRDKGVCDYFPSISLREKNIEQNHICLGFPGIAINNPQKYAISLFNTVFGGGMSSRLFSRVRDEEGLCYAINSFAVSHNIAGVIMIYSAVNPKSEKKALKLIKEEILKIKKDGITKKEFARAREQLKSSLLMDFESTTTRMKFMAGNELTKSDVKTIDEIIERVDAVNIEQILKIAEQYLDFNKASVSVVGKPQKNNFYEEFIKN